MRLGAAWKGNSIYAIKEVVTANLFGRTPTKVVGHGWQIENPVEVMSKSMDKDLDGVLEIARVAATRWRAEVGQDITALERKIKEKETKVNSLRAGANSMQKEIDDPEKRIDKDALGKKIALDMKLAEETEHEIGDMKHKVKGMKTRLNKEGEMTHEKLAEMVKCG